MREFLEILLDSTTKCLSAENEVELNSHRANTDVSRDSVSPSARTSEFFRIRISILAHAIFVREFFDIVRRAEKGERERTREDECAGQREKGTCCFIPFYLFY